MNENAVHLKDLIKGAGLSREATAALLYVSIEAVHKWLKPETTAVRNPCPRWAVELLAYKTHQKIPPMPAPDASDRPRMRNVPSRKVEPEATVEPAPKPIERRAAAKAKGVRGKGAA